MLLVFVMERQPNAFGKSLILSARQSYLTSNSDEMSPLYENRCLTVGLTSATSLPATPPCRPHASTRLSSSPPNNLTHFQPIALILALNHRLGILSSSSN